MDYSYSAYNEWYFFTIFQRSLLYPFSSSIFHFLTSNLLFFFVILPFPFFTVGLLWHCYENISSCHICMSSFYFIIRNCIVYTAIFSRGVHVDTMKRPGMLRRVWLQKCTNNGNLFCEVMLCTDVTFLTITLTKRVHIGLLFKRMSHPPNNSKMFSSNGEI